MAVKIDKEVLIKHHFWILTGLCVILVLIPIFCLWFGVNDTVAAEEKKLTEAKNKAKGITNPKNEKHVEAYKKQDGYVEKKQTEVWKQASETQMDLMTWPEKLVEQFPSFKTKYFGDPIEQFADNLYAQEYATQLPAVLAIVQPLAPNINFQGVDKIVQFRGDSWNDVLQLLRKFDGTPTREDIWLAQEDLWVKRELLAVVRAANDAVATLHEVKPQQPPAALATAPAPAAKDAKDAKSPKDAKDAKMARLLPAPVTNQNHKVFKNYFWEMDLNLARNAKNKWVLRGKVTNVGKQRRTLGAFRIYLAQDSAPAILPVNHEPLAAGQSADLGENQVPDALNISGLYGVEEVLTWRTAPVKRIDDVELDKNCSRFARYSNLLEPRWVEKAAEQPAGAAAEPGMGGDMREKMGGVAAKGVGGFGQTGFGGQGGTTKNGLSLKRYIDTNNQVRHMPVGMVVIVDEDFIHEFLGAFANSRLRTQTLQCHWHHIREKIKPASEGGAPAAGQLAEKGKPQERDAMPGSMRPNLGKGGAPTEPGMGGGMRMPSPSGQAKGMGGAGMMMGMGGGLAGGFRPTESGDEEEAEMNLVELSVYGLASLYEKYPPKPEAPAAEAPKN